eukprot:4117253-Prymnesium_polylepis.1
MLPTASTDGLGDEDGWGDDGWDAQPACDSPSYVSYPEGEAAIRIQAAMRGLLTRRMVQYAARRDSVYSSSSLHALYVPMMDDNAVALFKGCALRIQRAWRRRPERLVIEAGSLLMQQLLE